MQSSVWPTADFRLVKSISSDGGHKRLRLSDGLVVPVQRFACVGVGDTVRLESGERIWVKTLDGEVQVTPAFSECLQLQLVDGFRLPVSLHEITDLDDMLAYEALAHFHYRSDKGFGRRAILLMTALDPRFPKELGFIEITTPFLHLSNRTALFNSPFCDPNRGLSWSHWDVATRNRLTNVVARISRIVVHPEVRGLGLSRPLIDAASRYSASRWQVKGLRPLFLEITADMLKFMPFVTSSGMRYIGTSAGNLGRLAKDMGYLSRAAETHQKTGRTMTGQPNHSVLTMKGKGILGRQKRDVNISQALKDSVSPGLAVDDFLRDLINSGDVDSQAAEVLLPLLRYPKPTYMKGLSRYAEAFIRNRTNNLRLSHGLESFASTGNPSSGPLIVRNLTIDYSMDITPSGQTNDRDIRRAFGLSRSFEFRTGVHDLTFTLHPGQLCYIYGASGSGKTSLLKRLDPTQEGNVVMKSRGSVIWPSDTRIGRSDTAFPRDKPLIEAIGAHSLVEAVFALNSAGLAEPRLYLSCANQLSAGQVYRAHLARLMCSDSNVWLLDEFASGLDDATAMAVARSFARIAKRREIICVVATVKREPILNAMAPDLFIILNQLGKAAITTNWQMGL